MCYVNISSGVQNVRYDGVRMLACYIKIMSNVQNARYDVVNV